MLRLAKASLHVKRHLTEREIGTIALALAHLVASPDQLIDEAAAAQHVGDVGMLSDDDMRALIQELTTARKVKVCRSKQRES